MSAPLLEVERLVKEFRGRGGRRRGWRRPAPVRALDDVSLAVHDGEALGIVGETGSGKSTLARIMLALEEPTSGTIRWRGEEVTHARGPALRALRRERQIVFQDPTSSLNPRRTVDAIVAEPFAIHRELPDREARRRRVDELLAKVGLAPEHRDRYPHELSGGQRQRVAVARAIALHPRLLVADEPVSALDVSIQAQVLNLLRDLRRELGLTLVLISHDLSVVRHLCDRVAVMRSGQVVELAPVDELFAAPRADYTRELLAAVPRLPAPGRAPEAQSSSSSST
jgi:ABC-type glutathione transport system ATPase component